MNFLTFSWVDYTLFCLMFGLSCAVGIYFGCFKQQQTTSDYLLGGKNMKVFPVSMSLVASTLSGVTLLGIPAEVYLHGMQFSMMALSLFIAGFFISFIYLPVFYKLQLTNAFEYLEMRFDNRIKTIASIFYTLANIVCLPVAIYAPSLAFNQVTGFDLHIIALVMSLICIFYTTIGGLKAVVWTDTLQFSVTLCTLGCVLVMGILSVGGLGTIWERSELGGRLEFFNMDPDPTVRSTFWSVVLGNIFLWISFLGVDPAAVQRSMAVPTFRDAQKCVIIYVVLTIITKLISCYSGLIMYAKYYDCDPLSAGYIKRADQILPYYVLEVAAAIPGLSGLFLSGLFSTALSTLSTYLNTLSGIFYTDFIAPFMATNTSEKKASAIMKIMTVVLGLISLCLVFVVERLGTILELMLSLKAITTGPIVGLFTMGMLFPFANRKGALFGGIASLLLMSLIIIKCQIHIWNGTIRHIPKPLHTDECNTTTILPFLLNETFASTTARSTITNSEEPFWLYRISFYYYFMIGTLVTLIVGLPVSWITRNDKKSYIHPDLLSPFVRRYFTKTTETAQHDLAEKELDVFIKNNKNIIYTEADCNKLLK